MLRKSNTRKLLELSDFAYINEYGDLVLASSDVNNIPAPYVDAANDGSITYIGYYEKGTKATSEANFAIKKITVAVGASYTTTITTYASGNMHYDKIWDNRASYTYTFLQ
jgi:hypothetical protein